MSKRNQVTLGGVLADNRILVAVLAMREKLDGSTTITAEQKEKLEQTLEFSGHGEWAAYQDRRALAQAEGRLTLEESQTVYALLGATYSPSWNSHADLAAKLVVTKLMGELVGVKFG